MILSGMELETAHPFSKYAGSRPTGILSLDLALGTHGLPKGLVVELFGPPMAGKTLISFTSMIEAQRLFKERSLYIDGEFCWDADLSTSNWYKNLGGDPELVDILIPKLSVKKSYETMSAEEIYDEILKSGAKGDYAYIVLDSLAGMIPRNSLVSMAERGGFHTDAARLNTEFFRQAEAVFFGTPTTLLVINHEKHTMSGRGISVGYTPGGVGKDFTFQQRIRLGTPQEKTDEGQRITGQITKNKKSAPFRKFDAYLNFARGMDREKELVDLGIKMELIAKSDKSAWLEYEKERYQGKDAMAEGLRANPKVGTALRESVVENASKLFGPGPYGGEEE